MMIVKRLLLAALLTASAAGAAASEIQGPSEFYTAPAADGGSLRGEVRGEAAARIYELLARSAEPRSYWGGKCLVLEAQGITCKKDMRWLESGEEARHACIFGIDSTGLKTDSPAQTYCVMTAGMGVGN